ncbi:DUF5999 family protein [Streptomyces sp. NPDC016566]|uniref:DUF5999 family protein n=1 Tax=Streptomyces sp. NPDC016566 TaxID=3364967 RepID=UPI0036FA2FF5
MSLHVPPGPAAHASDRETATVVARHDEQGWSLMSDGSIVFDDTGELLPDGQIVPPHRPIPAGVSA